MEYCIIHHTYNEIECDESSLDENDGNFNFNGGYDNDAQNFSRAFCSPVLFLF